MWSEVLLSLSAETETFRLCLEKPNRNIENYLQFKALGKHSAHNYAHAHAHSTHVHTQSLTDRKETNMFILCAKEMTPGTQTHPDYEE